jgi:hypothetical protein
MALEVLRCGSIGGKRKTLAAPARVRGCSVLVELVALVPPCPSVSPGAGNEPEKAIKPRKRAKKIEERYVGQAGWLERDVDAPAIRRDRDGDGATISTIQPAQGGLH